MDTITFIRQALDHSKGWAQMLIEDMKDQPLVHPTPRGGNHPLWVIGHLAYGEAMLLDVFLCGREHRLAHWSDIFGHGSEPVADADKYPAFDEVMATFEELRKDTLALLNTVSADDLDQKSHAPEDSPELFQTVGGCFSALIQHTTFHTGQVADARRAAGRGPVLM